MSVVQVLYLSVGTTALVAMMSAGMNRVIRSERKYVEHRRQQWIDGGCKPEDEPNFDLGFPHS